VALKSDIEMCGTDQKFNCLVGRALQQESGQAPEVIMAMPILEGLDGVKKMSKSLGNYVGVTEPSHDMFGKIMSVSDDLMWKYYELLSDDASWTDKRARVGKGEYHPRQAKVDLALEITTRYHGKEAADEAHRYFEQRHSFGAGVDYAQVRLGAGPYKAPDLLVQAGVTGSKSEAKRLIQQGAMFWGEGSVEPRKVENFNEIIELKSGVSGVLKCGKAFLRIVS
jgi:tyrosyl-tRNA synthetase